MYYIDVLKTNLFLITVQLILRLPLPSFHTPIPLTPAAIKQQFFSYIVPLLIVRREKEPR